MKLVHFNRHFTRDTYLFFKEVIFLFDDGPAVSIKSSRPIQQIMQKFNEQRSLTVLFKLLFISKSGTHGLFLLSWLQIEAITLSAYKKIQGTILKIKRELASHKQWVEDGINLQELLFSFRRKRKIKSSYLCIQTNWNKII